MKNLEWTLALVACIGAHIDLSHASTAADRLLEIAKAGKRVSPADIRREASLLLADLGASAAFQERVASMGEWDVTAAPGAMQLDAVDHNIIIASGPVTVKRAIYAVVIAAGDVRIESGAELLVVSGGNITFEQDFEREWAGVFVSRGRLTAPWLARAALHARGGANVRSNSIDVLAYNTDFRGPRTARLELRSGKSVFSGDVAPAGKPPAAPAYRPELEFAGERCDAGVPLAVVAERIPKMAREKTKCSDIDLLVVTCRPDAAKAKTDEVWTVHACSNVLVDIRARMVGGAPEISFVPLPGPPAAVAVAVPPKYGPAPQGALPGMQGYAATPAITCPAPRPPALSVDQLERSYDGTGFAFTRSTLSGMQVASYFGLTKPLTISKVEWSGSVLDAGTEEHFVIRIFRDANGEPGPLVHEATVVAQARSVNKPGYKGFGHPFAFSTAIRPIALPPGQYWLSVIDSKPSGINFMWSVERGAGSGQCGSGGTWRQGDMGLWTHVYTSLPHRSARGYSFRFE